jgi:cystathionine beta-lyase/cystathionine gamma-synthase
MKTNKLGFATNCVHAGQKPEGLTGAVMTPIFQTSTFVQSSPGQHKGYEYSRSHNPTRTALEKNLSALEHAQFAHCFSSGCAATTIVMLALNPGDHVIAMDDLYGGTRRLFTHVFQRFGIKFSFADLSDLKNLESLVTPQTKIIWLESPSNPMLKLIDITAVGQLSKSYNIALVVDNTFATPALQNPLLLGAKIVTHSTTKYIGGHSDVVGGALMTNDPHWSEKFAYLSNAVGAIPAPLDCFLLLRGAKTLDIRMKQHCENALHIAKNLSDHPQVSQVFYPGLPSHPQFELATRQMAGGSGMISFIVKGQEAQARQICERTKLFACAESLGGVESLIEHPSSMTHASISQEMRHELGIVDGLLRLSVGIENKDDLWRDLEQAIQ